MNAQQRRKMLRKLIRTYARPEQLVAMRLEGANLRYISMYIVDNAVKDNWMQVRLYLHIYKQLGVKP